MKKQIFIIIILYVLISCTPKSECFDGRIILDEVEAIVKYENWKESLFIEKEGKKYYACNFPDSLIKKQNYKASFKLLQTQPNEKWVGQPCEIVKLEILKEQDFESLEIDQKTLFTGGAGVTENGKTITNGIYVTKISDNKIKYAFSEIIDWKDRRELSGTAIFQSSNNDKLETQNKEIESAFKFVDSENNIEILITKDFKINQARSRLIEKDKSKVSGLMYNK